MTSKWQLPPLPDSVRFAIARFRHRHPSAQLEERLARAFEQVDRGSSSAELSQAREARSSRAAKSWRRSPTWALSGVALLLGLALLSTVLWRQITKPTLESGPSREVAVQLSADGSGWAELPWNLHAHPAGHARVRLDVPVELASAEFLPSPRTTVCESDRCVHRFTTSSDEAGSPLRLRIPSPGRYEIHVHHISRHRNLDEHFVVTATRETLP